MRRMRQFLIILALFLCLLCGCGGTQDDVQAALTLRTDLLEAGGCRFTADITANCGDSAYTFTLECTGGPETTVFTVTAPESIAGISASMASGETKVTYDEMVLVFEDLAAGSVSAAACPGILYSAWTEGYVSAGGEDGDAMKITYLLGYDAEELRVDTWLDENGLPCQAELYSGGEKILDCAISGFSYGG